MDLLKPRNWTASDIGLIKASSALFGIAVGLSLPKRCKGYAPLLLLGVAALALKPTLHYFQKAANEGPSFKHDYEADTDYDADERTPAGENL